MLNSQPIKGLKILTLLGLMLMTFASAWNTVNAETEDVQAAQSLKGIPGKIEYSSDEDLVAWQRLQYGMFIHWGLFSQLGGVWNDAPVTKGYSEQIQMWANIPEADYIRVAADNFKAEKFDPDAICSLAKDAGMKYVVITSKHHDGFAMFDTATTNYNVVEKTPYGKDPLKELANACRSIGLQFGVYFSLVDWHEGHAFDNNNNNPIPASMEPIIENQLRELMTNYGPIAEVWFDMSSPTQAQSKKFAQIVRDLQPHAAINSRIWNNESDFRTLGDNQIPTSILDGAWQTPASIYHSTWGYRSWQVRDNLEGKVRDLVIGLTSVRARGGNYLLNIGPRGDGSVVEFEADVLRAIGSWLDKHPGAVLGASATRFGKQPWGEVTVNDRDLFLHVTNWPSTGELTLSGLATQVLKVQGDGDSGEFEWRRDGDDLIISIPKQPTDSILPVIKVELADELRIIPAKTQMISNEGTWTINSSSLDLGRSYYDGGSYYTNKQSTIRQTAYLASPKGGQVYLELNGKATSAGMKYRVEIGNRSYVVTGDELTKGKIGPFTVPANEVTPFTITLAEPAYFSQDLGLQFTSASIAMQSNSSMLSGAGIVDAGGSFDLTYGLSNVKGDIYAQDLTFSYDPAKLEFVAADSLKTGFQIITKNEVPGQIRILAASLGQDQVINSDGNLLKLTWKAKSLTESAQTEITLSDAVVSDGQGVETQLLGASHSLSIIYTAPVDKSALHDAISSAQSLYDSAVEGDKVGQYPVGSKAVLNAAIESAQAVADDAAATQEQVNAAVSDLNAAMSAFAASINVAVPGDLNEDGKVSIGDLAIVAKYYGKTSSDPDWETIYKVADLKKDGIIDIEDLVILAQLILES